MNVNGLSDDGYCEGCGVKVDLPSEEQRVDNPQVMREPSGDAAGRVTVSYLRFAIHQCADGEYLARGQVAPHTE